MIRVEGGQLEIGATDEQEPFAEKNEYPAHSVDLPTFYIGQFPVYALATKRGPQESIDFAVAASCLKHSIEHDFNLVTVQEVEALAAGNGTGRVQR